MIRRSLALCLVIAAMTAATSFTSTPHAGEILVGRVHNAFQPTRGKIFVLVIGNDARHGNPTHSRADAIHIVGIDTD